MLILILFLLLPKSFFAVWIEVTDMFESLKRVVAQFFLFFALAKGCGVLSSIFFVISRGLIFGLFWY